MDSSFQPREVRMQFLRTTLAALCLTAATAQLADAQTTIELWSFLRPTDADVRSQMFAEVIKSFEAANPGITIKTTVMDWTDIGPALLRGSAAGRVPDVTMMFSAVIGIHVAAKSLQPLDPYIAKWSKESQQDIVIFPNAKDREGHVYGLPWEMRVTGILYRKDLLDKAGLGVPKTLPELVAAAKRVGPPGGVGIGIGFSPAKPDAAMDWFIPTLVGMGAKPLNQDGTANFQTPQMKQLIGWIRDVINTEKMLPPDVALLGDDQVQTFAEAGRTVFLPKMTHRLGFIRDKSGLGQDYQMMNAPTFDPAKPAPAYVQGWNLSIPRGAKNPDGAWKLIEHWTSKDIQVLQGKKAGYLPVRTSAAADPAFSDPSAAHIKWALEYSSKYPLDFEWPTNISFLYSTLATAVSSIVSNQTGLDEALAKAEQAYNSGRK
jgi:ABC-type glycerol-3-phosphate transport system substrate-binding protein